MPNYGEIFGDIDRVLEIASLVEENGWDGYFLWDHLPVNSKIPSQLLDTWTCLTGIASMIKKYF